MAVGGPAVDGVVVGIGEEKMAINAVLAGKPYGAFGEAKAVGDFFDLRVRRDDLVEGGVGADDLSLVLDANSGVVFGVKIEGSVADPDEVAGRAGEWAVGGEYSELDLLARFGIAGEEDAVG